jgi:hypothetical protein
MSHHTQPLIYSFFSLFREYFISFYKQTHIDKTLHISYLFFIIIIEH